MKNLAEEARSILQEYVDKEHNGVRSRAANALGIANMTLKQWLDGTRVPNLENLSPAFERLGISFSKPAVQEVTRDVCWVNAKVMPAGEHVAPPVAEDYLAAPLVGEVGAGPGYLPQESVESWFLVYKHVPAIMGRRNLIAVEIGKTSTSMPLSFFRSGRLCLQGKVRSTPPSRDSSRGMESAPAERAPGSASFPASPTA